MKNKLLTIAIFTLVFSACFDGYQGNEGTLTINLGGGGRGVYVPWLQDNYELIYVINLDGGPGGPYSKEIPPPGGTAHFSVAPGDWNISVEAYEIYEDGGIHRRLIAVGHGNVTIKPGQNSAVTITLGKPPTEEPPPDENIYLIVGEGEEGTAYDTLAAALIAVKGVEGQGIFKVSIYNGEHSFNLSDEVYDGDNFKIIDEGKTVTIENRGNGTATIKLDINAKGYIFLVNGTLTLQGNITLDGMGNDNDYALIVVNGSEGIFNMGRDGENDNVVITGNNNCSQEYYGGAVCVNAYGFFYMYSGEIRGNTATNGGGVYVANDGTFNMYGGIITGNKATTNGGGVYVDDDGTFYGNEQRIINNFSEGNDKNIRNND